MIEWWDDDVQRRGVLAGEPDDGWVRVMEVLGPAPGGGVFGRFHTVRVESISEAASRVAGVVLPGSTK